MLLSCNWISMWGFILHVTLSPFINNEHTSRCQCRHKGLAPLGRLAYSRMRSHSASDSIFSRSSWFGSCSPLSAWHLTHAYMTSVLLHQLCCRYFVVTIKSWSPSVLWNMLCVRSLFDARIVALLSHINFMRLALIRPDRRSVPSTARPAIMPLSSDLYDVTYLLGPSLGPPAASSISSVSVASIQLWYPTPNRTDPSVAIIRSTSLVTYHCRSSPMSPTRRCPCLGRAWNASPMDDTYGTSCVIYVMCCVCMGVCSLISIYRCGWVTVATSCLV
jgi:hypothetical protein